MNIQAHHWPYICKLAEEYHFNSEMTAWLDARGKCGVDWEFYSSTRTPSGRFADMRYTGYIRFRSKSLYVEWQLNYG